MCLEDKSSEANSTAFLTSVFGQQEEQDEKETAPDEIGNIDSTNVAIDAHVFTQLSEADKQKDTVENNHDHGNVWSPPLAIEVHNQSSNDKENAISTDIHNLAHTVSATQILREKYRYGKIFTNLYVCNQFIVSF